MALMAREIQLNSRDAFVVTIIEIQIKECFTTLCITDMHAGHGTRDVLHGAADVADAVPSHSDLRLTDETYIKDDTSLAAIVETHTDTHTMPRGVNTSQSQLTEDIRAGIELLMSYRHAFHSD